MILCPEHSDDLEPPGYCHDGSDTPTSQLHATSQQLQDLSLALRQSSNSPTPATPAVPEASRMLRATTPLKAGAAARQADQLRAAGQQQEAAQLVPVLQAAAAGQLQADGEADPAAAAVWQQRRAWLTAQLQAAGAQPQALSSTASLTSSSATAPKPPPSPREDIDYQLAMASAEAWHTPGLDSASTAAGAWWQLPSAARAQAALPPWVRAHSLRLVLAA